MRAHISFGKFSWYRDPPRNQISATLIAILIFFYAISMAGQSRLSSIKQHVNAHIMHLSINEGLSQCHISTLILDQIGFNWIGTAIGGLNRYDTQKVTFGILTQRGALYNNLIYGIMASRQGNLLLNINQGSLRFAKGERSFASSAKDNHRSYEFSRGVIYMSPPMEMFLGDNHGCNSFLPPRIKTQPHQALLMITRLNLLNDESAGKNQQLLRHIEELKKVVFATEFTRLDFFSPGKNQVSYYGGSPPDTLIDQAGSRLETFTKLNPETYFFRVRSASNNGGWRQHEAALKIPFLPQWLTRDWIVLVFLLLAIVAIVGLRKYELSRFRLRNRMLIAEMETEKLKELDHLKSQFFTNISHEFRTPLTLILGPVEKMIEEASEPKSQKNLLEIHQNARRLLALINQLLELSKLESGSYELKVSSGDFISLIKSLVNSFASKAEQKNIKLEFSFDPQLISPEFNDHFYFCHDIVEKIVNNLLSNAFKFTPDNGYVKVEACLNRLKDKMQVVEIIFSDSGIGIPAEKLPYIFDRFYQAHAPSKHDYEGSGIGLALVKELVGQHKGSIIAKSQPDKGAIFSLRLPYGKGHYTSDQIVSRPLVEAGKETVNEGSNALRLTEQNWQLPIDNGTKVPLVLVVEDHADVRHFIAEILGEQFRVREAENATEGERLALEMIPDLIISDVMMPGMDGFEFCEKLKTDERTSHIPVILLTALAEDPERMHGLETGADTYLTKPFNPKELLIRAGNLVENRRIMREKFSTKAIIKPGEITVTSRDRAFMEKLMSIIMENMGNEKFSVEDLAREAGMSQSQLHRKLKALINQTANHFIRSARMHRAKELLEKDAGTIAEIAYMVGYNDPGYFAKSCKSFFGILPSEIKNQVKK